MDKPILNDKDQFPTDEVIFQHIGKSKVHWESFFEFMHTTHPDFIEQWRFYKDGKSWLMKVVKKSKTIFWLSIIKNGFRITFYFGDKAEQMILDSTISDSLKNEFKNGQRYGKIRGLTILMNTKKNIEFAKELISIKLKIK